MKRLIWAVPLLALLSLYAPQTPTSPAQDAKEKDKGEVEVPKPPKKPMTFTTERNWRTSKSSPDGGHPVFFYDHAKMKAKMGNHKVAAGAWPVAPTVFDHGAKINYPMLLNDQLGCCFYSSICHQDQTFTGNNGPQSNFSLTVFRQRYIALSGGDNGLSDDDVQGEWKNRYLADVKEAKAFDYLYIDVTNPKVLAAAIYETGGVQFTFTVAQAWINNSDTGDVWDAPEYRANNNGHAVHLVGVNDKGHVKLVTWGTYVWITPAAIKVCNPDGFVVNSTRWFNAKGYAPTGKHVTEVSKIIVTAGGKPFPQTIIDSFPPPGVIPPIPPGPGPNPSKAVRIKVYDTLPPGDYEAVPAGTIAAQDDLRAKIEEIKKLLDNLPKFDKQPKADDKEQHKEAPKVEPTKESSKLSTKTLSELVEAWVKREVQHASRP